MKMSKLGYFFEFLLFPPLVLIATFVAFRNPFPPRPTIWAVGCGGGLIGWTFIEYLLHRVLFHHAPVLSQIHASHHQSPQELIGTPAWASVILGLIVIGGPSWETLGFNLGTAVTTGVVTGYLWYVFVHYAIHHWQPRQNSYFYRAWLRHAVHHHHSQHRNFGVTTALWDHIFGTASKDMPSGRLS